MLPKARTCPSDATIAEFADGRLGGPALTGVEHHIGVCDACRDLVVEMAKLTSDERSVRGVSLAAPVRYRRGALRLPTVDAESYVVERELARGGMGRILEAWDCIHQRPVALKVALHGSDQARQRFEREIAVTAMLSHPAIIPLYAAGRWTDGEPFFAMKRVDGESFAGVAAAAATMKDKLARLPHLVAVTEALAYAHDRGVVHRDLKPANVLVGAFGETVVIDWGLAKQLDDEGADRDGVAAPGVEGAPLSTAAGHAIGTPSFMPPEQARGEDVDARADVYALGALLYYLLAGAPPHAAKSAGDTVRAVLAGPPESLAARAPDAPRDLVALAEKGMARDPNDRYPTAGEMADDLRRFVTGQLVSAHNYTFGVLVRRWATRHKSALSIAGAALLVVALLSAFGVRGIVRERDRADVAKAVAERERKAAVTQRDAAEQLVGYVITTLRARLETLGRLDLLRGVGQEVDTYYESASQAETLDAPALVRRAAALQSLAAVETFKLDAPGAAPLFASAERLLEHALALDPGNLDAAVELVHVLVSEAGGLLDEGRLDLAEERTERAIDVGKRAVAAHPGDARAMAAQSRGLLRRALVLRAADRSGEIAPLYDEACALLDRAHDAAPADREILRQLGWGYLEKGDSARLRGDNAVALPALERSVDVRRQLLAADPGAARKRDLAWSLLRLGEVNNKLGAVTEAIANFERTLTLREELLASDPANESLQRDVAITLQVIALHEYPLRRTDDAIAHAKRALSTMEGLSTRTPENLTLKADLGLILSSLGHAELEAGRAHDAAAHFVASGDVLTKLPPQFSPEVTAGLDLLWPALARARLDEGDVAAARVEAGRAIARTEQRTAEHPRDEDAWTALGEARMVLGDLAAGREDAAAAIREYRAARDAFARAQRVGGDPLVQAVDTEQASVALAKLLPKTAAGRIEARALLDGVVAALGPIERAGHLLPRGVEVLAAARAELARGS